VTQHVVVDGSNVATEGRDSPSLAQLEAALAELKKDLPEAEFTVVVDATFAHRIDPSERARYDELVASGALVSPPAGAIGRGDAFLLRIAERIDGTVLSNDSFQEFHGEHPWLFERGRLLGATPVPGIGFIFSPRQPVRGPKSRVAVRDGERAKRQVERAIEEATKEAVDPEPTPAPGGRARQTKSAPAAVNDPATFIKFIAEHPLGTKIEAEVESFTSHGAVIRYGDVQCYAPLSLLGNPPPKSAREVLRRGDRRTFVLTALDPHRRGVELALPDVASVSGRPTDETVAAEVGIVRRRRPRAAKAPEAADAAPPTPPELPSTVAGRSGRSRRSRTPAEPPTPAAPSTPPKASKKASTATNPSKGPSASIPVESQAGATVEPPEESGPRRRRSRPGVTGVLRRRKAVQE
jgi:hypothetical protein